VADWWLGTAWVVLGARAAAAPPATTTERAKMRMMCFIVGNPSAIWIDREGISPHDGIVEDKLQ
jgi:hypothetical protein